MFSMRSKITAHVFSIILSPSATIYSAETVTATKPAPYIILNLSINVPHEAKLVVLNFIRGLDENHTEHTSPFLRRVILHSDHALANAFLAQTIAAATNSELIGLKASELVDRQYSSCIHVQKVFDNIDKKLVSGTKNIVLFIDDIDAIASILIKQATHFAEEIAHTHLRLCSDEYSEDTRLLILFGTKEKYIQEILTSRCSRVEVPHRSDDHIMKLNAIEKTITDETKKWHDEVDDLILIYKLKDLVHRTQNEDDIKRNPELARVLKEAEATNPAQRVKDILSKPIPSELKASLLKVLLS
jgi:hypothetical protein